ncbi:PKD2 [Symbiodinium natans]|uniref:PKD2 protein n=1 Tax=Symbiodinium natans TaxID=878477 RepID=A0A812KPC2_9DINO|nr:PKD2 [Symbiodinium natans]
MSQSDACSAKERCQLRQRLRDGAPAFAGFQEAEVVTEMGGMYLAKTPDDSVRQPWPVLIFLHGAGERGHEDGRDLGKVRNNGPWTLAAVKRLFLVAPQCPEALVWPAIADRIVALTKQVRDEFSLDPNRIYISGLSMGAFGAFAAASAAPGLFAALIGVCGGFTKQLPLETSLNSMLQLAKVAPKEDDLSNIRELPIWLFHGMKDRTVDPDGSMLLYQALGGKGRGRAKLRLTKYEALGHQIWTSAYKTSDLFPWLLRHKKSKQGGLAQDGGF